MNPPCTHFSFFSSSTAYALHDEHTHSQTITQIPIHSPSDQPPIPITLHLPQSDAAVKIQSAYRAHLVRTLYNTISSVNSEANRFQAQIQRQETVDAIRRDERERVRMNETLMGLLLRLDSVPGIDPTVRDARRKVSRRIVGLQEIVDAICEAKVSGEDDYDGWWDPQGHGRMVGDWDEVVARMEEEVCRERGGEEMEKFCADYLGFRCLQKFLRQP